MHLSKWNEILTIQHSPFLLPCVFTGGKLTSDNDSSLTAVLLVTDELPIMIG